MIYLITCIEKSNGSKVCITKVSQYSMSMIE